MSDTFADLAASFNQSAADCQRDGIRIPFLVAKYAVLLNHYAENADQRKQIVDTMLDTGLFWLNKIADPEFSMNIAGEAVKLIAPLFDALASPDTLNAIPDGAASKLALAAFKLSTKGETLAVNDFRRHNDAEGIFLGNRNELLGLTQMALTCANTFRDAAKAKAELGNVTTAQPVTASRPITLKSMGQPA